MECSNYSAGSIFVSIHILDGNGWLQVKTTGVVGETLADKRNVNVRAFRVSLVVNDDATRTINSALADCIEEVHSELLKLFHSQDSDLFDKLFGLCVLVTRGNNLNLIFHPLRGCWIASRVCKITSVNSGFRTVLVEHEFFTRLKFFLVRQSKIVESLFCARQPIVTFFLL